MRSLGVAKLCGVLFLLGAWALSAQPAASGFLLNAWGSNFGFRIARSLPQVLGLYLGEPGDGASWTNCAGCLRPLLPRVRSCAGLIRLFWSPAGPDFDNTVTLASIIVLIFLSILATQQSNTFGINLG